MPLRDQTGPEGKGPLTGRGAGSCSTGSGGGIAQAAAPLILLGLLIAALSKES